MNNLFDTIQRAVARADSWVNLVTGVGLNHRKNALAMAAANTDYLTDGTLEELFELDGIAARIVRAIPNHALREGFTVATGDASLDTTTKARLDELDAAGRLRLAWTWARLYGGGAVLVGAADGREAREPLDLAGIRSVRFLVDVDRTRLTPQTWCHDTRSARYGQPETYLMVRQGGTASETTTVHASRLIRFDGAEVTPQRRVALQGWGDSVLQRVYADLQQLRGAHAAIASLMHEASQGVFRMKDLMSMIGADKNDVLKRRLEIMDMSRSVARSILVDADGESFERIEVGAMTGMVDAIDRFVNFLAAVSEMPVTVLMGQAPAGLSATGESDIRSWYDAIAAEREAMLRPKVERLVRILMLAKDGPARGVEPASWKVTFPPLYQMTPEQKADVRLKVAQTDQVYATLNALTSDEIRASRFRPDGWSDETSLAPPPAITTETGAPVPEEKDPTTALNGAQVESLRGTITSVAAREIPRETGIEILIAAFPIDRAQAERIMGPTGQTFFTTPDPAQVAELDSTRAEVKTLRASNEGHKRYTARLIQRAKEGGLELGAFTAREPTETAEGDVLKPGDVVAVPAEQGPAQNGGA